MTNILAELIFWSSGIVMFMFVYQYAVLPGIRLTLRYRTFALRDRLRALVINGKVKESNHAFQLLHDQLNFMCSSLSTYDLARLIHSVKTMDDERRTQIARASKVMDESLEEIKEIYSESLNVCAKALVFNSLFIFVVATIVFVIVLFFTVGIRRIRNTLLNRVHEDAKVGLFAPELAAV
jgi:hypothetical protein